MRIFLLPFFSFLFFFSARSQVVSIPDANFKNALLNHNPVINTNGDGEIQVSEALAFTGTLRVDGKNIADLTGINAFTNLTALSCTGNQLTGLNIIGLNSLVSIYGDGNRFASLAFDNLPALQGIYLQNNLLTTLQLTNLPRLQTLTAEYNRFTSLGFSGLPALRLISIFSNSLLTDLTFDNLPKLTYLSFNGCKVSNLSMNNLPLLDTLFCTDNKLTSLTLPSPANLKILAASNNLFTNVPTGITNVRYLDVSNNQISNFQLDNFNFLTTLNVSQNLCTSLSLTNKPALKYVACGNNMITSLQLSNLPILTSLNCNGNQLTSLSFNGYGLFEELHCDLNQLTTLSLNNLPSFKMLYCDGNRLATLALSNLPSFSHLTCTGNQMTSLSLNNLPNLYSLYCNNNRLASLPFLTPGSFPKLRFLYIGDNQITRLSLDNFSALGSLDASNNPIDSLRLRNLPVFDWMKIEKNKLTTLKLDSLPRLKVLYCGKSDSLRNISLQLPVLTAFFCDSSNTSAIDLSQTLAHQVMITNNPLLQYINMRNTDITQYIPVSFKNNEQLQFICVDDAEKNLVTDSVYSQLPGQGVVVSTVCNFIPSISSIIKGTLRFDLDANGCNNIDSIMMNVRLDNDDGIYTTSAFSNNTGQYTFHTQANTDTVRVSLPQPSWFTVSPPVHVFSIPVPGVSITADFCLAPVGVHPDLDISIVSIRGARPGFDAKYRIVFSNKGNQVQSGGFMMNFDAAKLSFVSATVPPASQAGNAIHWNYTNLYPFQTRSVDVTFHVFPPPVANVGDTLHFTGVIDPIPGDETPADNTFNFTQLIRGAFDPNDKEVTEGSQISISRVGDFLHYIVHFQNEGNSPATRVVIKDSMADNLDWNSFKPMTSSHNCSTVISKGNKVEFLFNGINLPPKSVDEPASKGFIAFKVKTKNTLSLGDTIKNTASIYFDFNQPVITNMAFTVIVKPSDVTLTGNGSSPVGLTVYPNPAKDRLVFAIKNGGPVINARLINGLGQDVPFNFLENTGSMGKLDVSKLPPGIYILEVITAQSRDKEKFMILN